MSTRRQRVLELLADLVIGHEVKRVDGEADMVLAVWENGRELRRYPWSVVDAASDAGYIGIERGGAKLWPAGLQELQRVAALGYEEA